MLRTTLPIPPLTLKMAGVDFSFSIEKLVHQNISEMVRKDWNSRNMVSKVIKTDQVYMAVRWYLVKSDMSSARHCSSVHFLQGTINTRPCITEPWTLNLPKVFKNIFCTRVRSQMMIYVFPNDILRFLKKMNYLWVQIPHEDDILTITVWLSLHNPVVSKD